MAVNNNTSTDSSRTQTVLYGTTSLSLTLTSTTLEIHVVANNKIYANTFEIPQNVNYNKVFDSIVQKKANVQVQQDKVQITVEGGFFNFDLPPANMNEFNEMRLKIQKLVQILESKKPFHMTKKFPFTSSIHVTSTTWAEVGNYTTKFTVPTDLAFLHVGLHIPFTGSQQLEVRSRIRLMLDDIDVSDSTLFGGCQWQLTDVNLNGVVSDVSAGEHTLKLWASVSSGTLHIPHYNTGLTEHTQSPSIFANMYAYGLPL